MAHVRASTVDILLGFSPDADPIREEGGLTRNISVVGNTRGPIWELIDPISMRGIFPGCPGSPKVTLVK